MKAAVIGGGAWGTALAIRLNKNGHDTTLWCHRRESADRIVQDRLNPHLPEVILPSPLAVTSDPSCVTGCSLVVIASPSFPIRSVCQSIAPHLPKEALLVSVTKGIESGSLLRMSQVISQELHPGVVALTGPSHAEEVASDLPTGLLAACPDRDKAEAVQNAFMADHLRVYTSPDIVGAELGGALKNVIALCAGISDGLGYGDNTKAMLMTRGLTEIARLGVSLGAARDTFAGLGGIGDLIVTCTSMHSRNRRAGILIGQGHSISDALEKTGGVVEGYYAAKSAMALSQQQGIDMPIVRAAHQVLYENADPREAVHKLLTRQRKTESEDAGWL